MAEVSCTDHVSCFFWVRLVLTCALQRAPDCDMILVHDHDLERIGEMGVGTVSRHLVLQSVSNYIVPISQSLETFQPDSMMMIDLLGRSDIDIHKVDCGEHLTWTEWWYH